MCLNSLYVQTFLCHRQKMIELDKLLQYYAKEVPLNISNLALDLENCEGCHIDHPSKRQRDCLMVEDEEVLWLYFAIDSALEKVSAARIVDAFMDSLQSMKPNVSGLELLKYTCQD